jgi:hypothetical protein
MGEQAGGGDRAHLGGAARIQLVGDDLARVGRAAGPGQDDALARIVQALAEEGGDPALVGAQAGRQGAPDRGLLRDFLGSI